MNLNEVMDSPLGRAKRRLHNVWLHSVAQRRRIMDLALAKDAGVDPDAVEPFPVSSGDVTVVNQGSGIFRPALLALLCALGGAGTLAGIAMWVGLLDFSPPAPSVPSVPAVGEPVEFEVTFWGEDGKPIEVQERETSE